MKYFLLILIVITGTGCSFFSKKTLGRRDYMRWVTDPANGLNKSKVIGDIKFTVQYKPAEYIVLNEIGSQHLSVGAFDTAKQLYSGLQYFDIIIDPASGNENILKYHTTTTNEYYDNLNYYSFKMKEDIVLVDGDTTLLCVLFNFDNSHDLSKHSTAVVAFEKTSRAKEGAKVMRFNAERLGIGLVNIQIKEADLKRIPNLNYSEL